MKKIKLFIVASLLVAYNAYASDFTTTLNSLTGVSPANKNFITQAEAAVAESKISYNLPDPEIDGEHLWGAKGTTKWNAGISWNLEWPGLYSAIRNESAAVSALEDARISARQRALMLEVGSQLIEYARANSRLGVINRLLSATDSIACLIESGVRNGGMSQLDSSKIRIERGLLKTRAEEEKNAINVAETAIATLCGTKTHEILSQFDNSMFTDNGTTEAQYLARVAATPDMRLAEAEIALSKAKGKVANNETLPGFGLGYVHAYEEETHFNGAHLGVSIPLFSGRNKKQAAKAAQTAAEAEAESCRESLTAEVSALCNRLNTLRGTVDELDPVFNDKSAQQLLFKAFKLERISLLEYLQERNYYMEAELDYINLLSARSAILLKLSAL